MRRPMDRTRAYFESRIRRMEEEEDGAKVLPPLKIVNYHDLLETADLLEKLWGWDRLVPKGGQVSVVCLQPLPRSVLP